jgi:hypothetical protein
MGRTLASLGCSADDRFWRGPFKCFQSGQSKRDMQDVGLALRAHPESALLK